MKKHILILMAVLPLSLTAQVLSTGNAATVNPISVSSATGPLTVSGTQLSTGMIQVTGVPQLVGKRELSEVLGDFSGHGYNRFEINEEMFKAFCEMENADSATIALFSKIKSVKMLELVRTPKEQKLFDAGKMEDEPWNDSFYSSVISQIDLSQYTQLLKSKTYSTLTLFLKKEFGPADSEFLLITNRMVIDIRGDIKIKTIYQMEEMMGWVSQILPN